MFIKFFKYCHFNQQMFLYVIMIFKVFQEGELQLGRALLLGEIRYISEIVNKRTRDSKRTRDTKTVNLPVLQGKT